ncbi:uncharacterized protein LOC127869784 [Dreissena polymorpha]|uniref:Ankyrin n=1 Tax=Dreissena polymorpha TaxID=45954 RepID=A0A9D4RFX0_DREPO|nr:uncharacterized protein LOC127869784 [Dreissena polymorpha]KAH3867031.1 hypothetical protein DPMN_030156 [Dreissena polymorpha]
MVFREQTVLEVHHLVKKLEASDSPRRPSVPDLDALRDMTSSVEEPPTQRRWPTTRHARSCLGSNLFHSVFKGRLRKVKFLLDNGLDVNNRNDYGYNVLVAALHIEPEEKRRKMFKFLLNNNADPFQRDPKYKRSILAWSAVLGRHEQINLLLDTYMGEFDFHEKDKDGMTPLHLATQAGHTEVVKALVREMKKYGTTIDVPDGMGLTPYLHAKRLGYGLIADILRQEGGASEGQGDLYTFKKADEWREIGVKERNQELQRRRSSQYEQAAIAGSARMLMEFEGPGYEIISIPTPRARRRPKASTSSEADVSEKIAPKTVRIKSPKSQLSLPVGNDIRAYHHNNKHSLFENHNTLPYSDGNDREFISPSLDTMSLIQMREPRRGMAPKPFRSSELDTSKAKEYGHLVGDLTTMLEYLTIQHCKSFRRSVPPLKPMKDEAPVGGKKSSTLAIIFGKGKRGRKSPGGVAPGTGGKGKEKTGSGKGKRQKAS